MKVNRQNNDSTSSITVKEEAITEVLSIKSENM